MTIASSSIKPRPEVYDLYWQFAAERQRIFFRRLEGCEPPWSTDPIFQSYKFCNVYRAADRVSQYLIRSVIYSDSQEADEVLFRTVFFRLFNRNETWTYLKARLGAVTLETFNPAHYAQILAERHAAGEKIFGGAFILCANKAFGFDQKHGNYLALLAKMFVTDKVQNQILRAKSLEKVYQLLRSYPLIGTFMAYQIAVDLNYGAAVNFSENSFTVAGPGAERGIRKCFEGTGRYSTQDVIHYMVDSQEAEFSRLGLDFQSLWGRPLHAIDCQGLFCEVDKYSRVAHPELKSSRSRIKARFRPSTDTIPHFYPPKWNINHLINPTAPCGLLKQAKLPLV